VNNRDKQLLADRQQRVTEQYLQRAKRYLADFTTETRAEERFQNILGLADKLEHLSLSSDQWERYWSIVELGQQKLAELVPTVRVSTTEYSEPELSGRELGAGSIL
jgi:hypothetical protein